MKKIFCVFVMTMMCLAVLKMNAAAVSEIKLEDVTIEYTPEGYMPKAEFSEDLTESDICYLAINKESGLPVELPLVNVGEYVVKAYATIEESEISDIANVIITPVKAIISIDYDKLRYTGDEIIPEYTVYPEWTADLFQLNVTYTYYKSNDPKSAKLVNAPKQLGTYFVKMTPYGTGDNIECDGKAYILTIAENRGKKLSESKRTAPLGSGISGDVEDLNVVYNGIAPTIKYEMTPHAATPDLYFRLIGTNDEPVAELPTEPGEYEVTAVLCNQVIDRATLLIEKKIPTYTLEQTTYIYSPSGVVPHVTSREEPNLTFDIVAYLVDENDEPVSSQQLPLKKPGKYLLIINPSDITHYQTLYSPEYVYVEKCTPKITGETREFSYDGFAKNINYTVTPNWVNSKIEYYSLDENGEIIPSLDTDPPINVGNYVAVIQVDETEYVKEASLKVYFSIDEAFSSTVSRPEQSKTEYLFLGKATPQFTFIMISIPLALIVLFFVIVFCGRKKR